MHNFTLDLLALNAVVILIIFVITGNNWNIIIILYYNNSTAPSAPETITIEAVGKTWIKLSWQQVLFVSQYILTVSSGGSVVSVSISGSERQIKVSGLLPDTEYSVTVVVVYRNGQTSLPSAIVVASTAQIGIIHLYKLTMVYFSS